MRLAEPVGMKALQADRGLQRRSRASRRGMICSSSMRRSSRGTPGVKKNRALPMSSAKPQAVPIGLSRISAVRRQHRLLAVVRRHDAAAAVEERPPSSPAIPRSARVRRRPPGPRSPATDRRRSGPSPPLTMTASARSPACRNARSSVSRSSPTVVPQRTASPTSSSFWRDVAEIGVDDLAGQDFVAGADDLDLHARLSVALVSVGGVVGPAARVGQPPPDATGAHANHRSRTSEECVHHSGGGRVSRGA